MESSSEIVRGRVAATPQAGVVADESSGARVSQRPHTSAATAHIRSDRTRPQAWTTAEALKKLRADPEAGLAPDEVERRKAVFGDNVGNRADILPIALVTSFERAASAVQRRENERKRRSAPSAVLREDDASMTTPQE